MEIEVRDEGGRTTLVLSGSLTGEDAANLLRERIDQLLREGRREFVLDLERVPYMDSVGMGAVVRLYTTVIRLGGTLRLLNCTKRIRELWSIGKLSSSFLGPFEPWLHPRDWTAAMWFAFSVLLLAVIMIIRALG